MEKRPDTDERIQWAEAQKLLGCYHCYFADEEKLGEAPCCTYPGKLNIDEQGRCLRYRSR